MIALTFAFSDRYCPVRLRHPNHQDVDGRVSLPLCHCPGGVEMDRMGAWGIWRTGGQREAATTVDAGLGLYILLHGR